MLIYRTLGSDSKQLGGLSWGVESGTVKNAEFKEPADIKWNHPAVQELRNTPTTCCAWTFNRAVLA